MRSMLATGKPIAAFGKDGRIDLRGDLGRTSEKQSVALTSPGIVYKDPHYCWRAESGDSASGAG